MNKAVVAFAAVLWIARSDAAYTQGSIPSCYAAARLSVTVPRPARSVFVIVDQTTALDGELRRTISDNLNRLLQPGTSFTVATFSAFSRGHYTTVLSTGAVEGSVPPRLRPSLPVNRLAALDRCLVRQQQFARQLAARALARATGVPATTFSNSEIMASLAHLSESVRTAPGASKIVMVASDLIEHSSASSFYARHNLRLIDANAELRNALRHGLIANFGGARVYVVGTGLLPPSAGNSVRDVRALNGLITFWTNWFRRSNAASVVVGRPNLVSPVQ
jgi:hypothetical protein